MASNKSLSSKEIQANVKNQSEIETRSVCAEKEAAVTRKFSLKPVDNFKGSQLPTKREVLQRYFGIQDKSKHLPKRDIARLIFKDLSALYAKVPCPIKKEQKCLDQICKLHEKWRKTSKNEHRISRKPGTSISLFDSELNELFDILAKDAENQIRNDRLRSQRTRDEDISFLNDQRTSRKFFFDHPDKKYQCKYASKQERISKAKRSDQKRGDSQQIENSAEIDFNDPTPSTSKSSLDNEYKPSNFMLRKMSTDKSKKISQLVKDPILLSTLDRTNITSRSAVPVLAAAAQAMGKNIDECTLNRESIRKARRSFRAEKAFEIKNSFVPPKQAVVHFDGKLLCDLEGNFGERLAIMVSGNTQECKQGKLISAKLISDGTGKTMAKEIMNSLKEWKIIKNIVAMCFDTTNSNTGWLSGACATLEALMKKPLLWLPCRKHI